MQYYLSELNESEKERDKLVQRLSDYDESIDIMLSDYDKEKENSDKAIDELKE